MGITFTGVWAAVFGADKIINLPFADKYRPLRGILGGPLVVGHSTLNPHAGLDPEDEMMKMPEGIKMAIVHNHPLL